jgi:tripartite-type tricarboxylate transporter receptor subunit TctC
MNMHIRRVVLSVMTVALALAFAGINGDARAQKPLDHVTFIVGYPAGGATDTVARLVAEAILGKYATAVVVQNKTGAGGQIAAASLKELPADGTSLLFTPAFPLVIFPHVYKDIRYDTLKDFVPVATTHFGTLALSVGPGVPDDVKTLKDFIAWVKKNPDKASFGAPAGGAQHFTGLMLARDANIQLQLVSYRGGAPSVTDALGGHIAAVITPLAEVLPHAREGELRILATTARERSPLAPDIPTFFELGFEKIVVQDWSGFLAPAGTPPEIVARANAAINAAVESPGVKEAMARLGMEVGTLTPAAFAVTVRESWERYRDIVKASGFQAEQ